jgi:SAM-dependent methyltransferase
MSDPPGHFGALYRLTARLGPPLRPNEEVIAAYRRLIAGHAARVLLLGITRGLADVGAEVDAVDKDETVIARAWPGDTERRRAHKADWLALPFPARRFTAAVGDGALNSAGRVRDYRALLSELERVLEPGAPIVTRVYARPADCESVAAVAAAALAGEIPVFNALKWRLAMALVAEAGEPDIEVERIKAAFDRLFPDRGALAAAARYEIEDIATIDVYAGSRMIYSFPSLAEIRASVPDSLGEMRVVPAGTYPLAERCPLIVLRKNARA